MSDTPHALGTIPRRLLEHGGAVEEPSGLWHIAQSEMLTYCGEGCSEWPRVVRAVERGGIWCGLCLMEAVQLTKVETDAPETEPAYGEETTTRLWNRLRDRYRGGRFWPDER